MTVLSSYNREEEIILEGYSVEYGGKGNVFGTLCVMDKEEKVFSEEDINYLKSMADILSHMIELDQTKYGMGFLSVPIIPITKGISVHSIQGIVHGNRSEQIMSDVLHSAADNDIGYFIIDLSKLLVQDNCFPTFLFNMMSALV
ncbi:hypothetical protein M3699_22310 [Peribacillus simplex]|uniref:hypothetical protein n=1 Tax=Peribacillus simplex TaxID=1478 RepID=UPI0020409FAB|nr:hypothetical protein [Peribacillus simplex]MCM3676511.1 hypothetical protein [Peribacillus simplex]